MELDHLSQPQYSVRRKPVSGATAEYYPVGSNNNSKTSIIDNDIIPVPVRTNELNRDSWRYQVASALASISPIAFLVLTVFTAALHNQPESDWGGKIMNIILLVPSVYPVIFAALLSHDLRTYTLGLAQTGISVRMLHQLLSSTTFRGVFKTVWDVRTFNITLLLLVSLWSLSPLGGQAALRMISFQDVISSRVPTQVWYRSSDDAQYFQSTNPYENAYPLISELYAANFHAPPSTQKLPFDVFGNIRIPMLQGLDPASAIEDGWLPTGPSSPFISLVETPLQGVPKKGNGTFTVEANYDCLNCERPTAVSKLPPYLLSTFMGHFSNSADGDWVSRYTIGGMLPTMAVNMTDQDWSSGRAENRYQLQQPRKTGFASMLDRETVLVGEEREFKFTWVYTPCTNTHTYVEARVFCEDGDCGVTAVRPTRKDYEPPELGHLDGASSFINSIFYKYLSHVTDIDACRCIYRTTLSQRYIANTEAYTKLQYVNATTLYPWSIKITKLSAEALSTRLTTVYNTFYTVYSGLYNIQGTETNFTAEPPSKIQVGNRISIGTDLETKDQFALWKYRLGVPVEALDHAGKYSTLFAHNITTDFLQSEPRYVIHRRWMAAFLFSTCTLILVSLAGFFFQFRRIAPDFLGTVAGMLRDSPFVNLNPNPAPVEQPLREHLSMVAELSVRFLEQKRRGGLVI